MGSTESTGDLHVCTDQIKTSTLIPWAFDSSMCRGVGKFNICG